MPFARSLRLIVVVLSLGILLAGFDVCPTGQASCDMASMEDVQSDGPICVLACGVPLQQSVLDARFSPGETSISSVQTIISVAGLRMEPEVPPPRKLG